MKLKIAACAVNPTVGDLEGNADMIIACYDKAAGSGASIAVMPEMVLTGYPIEDLTQNAAFLADAEKARQRVVAHVRAHGGDTALLFGHPTDTGRHDGNRRLVHNSATLVDPRNPELQVTHKRELPSYGVFDEKRDYLEGPPPRVMTFRGLRIGVPICEDGWFEEVPKSLAAQGADIMLWINGSPFAIGKNVVRREHANRIFDKHRVPVLYVNMVGGQDELVFDGDCFSLDGKWQWQGPLFESYVKIIDFDVQRSQATRDVERRMPLAVTPTGIGEVYRAKVLGLKDYTRKTGFKKIMLGMSGGMDSACVASIGADAIGPENVLLVRLPSTYSSSGSLTDAKAARDLLGCPMRTIAIEPTVQALRAAYGSMQYDTPELDPAVSNPVLTGVADENIQARARGAIMMAISNQEGYLLVSTGNKSELAVSYYSLYGDSCGGFNLLKDTLKTDVSVAAGRNVESIEDIDILCSVFGPGLVQWRNKLNQEDVKKYGFMGPAGRTVPFEIEAKGESAELAKDQLDSNSLPRYPILDGIVRCLIQLRMGIDDTVNPDRDDPLIRQILAQTRIDPLEPKEAAIERGFKRNDVAFVSRQIRLGEHKRRQTAPGPKVSSMIYGRDRRMPIVNGYTG
jgi:NAD+ synthase